MYSVMQSDGNSLYGDVVLDSFKKTSQDKDSILDQIYKSKHVRISIFVRYIYVYFYYGFYGSQLSAQYHWNVMTI